MITLRNLENKIDNLETEAYGLSLDATYEECADMLDRAAELFCLVQAYFGVEYWNPGEPWCTNSQFKIPVTGCDAGSNGGMRSDEEDRAEMENYDGGGDGCLLPGDLYWARLRIAQAKDLIENGWQSAGADYDEVKFAFLGGQFSRAELPPYCTFATDEQMVAIANEADRLLMGSHRVACAQRAAYNVIGRELEETYEELK